MALTTKYCKWTESVMGNGWATSCDAALSPTMGALFLALVPIKFCPFCGKRAMIKPVKEDKPEVTH